MKAHTLAKLLSEQQFEESIYNLGQNADENQSIAGHHIAQQDDTKSIYSIQTGITGVTGVTYATEQLGITE